LWVSTLVSRAPPGNGQANKQAIRPAAKAAATIHRRYPARIFDAR
jgi:hypothetical protein